MKQAVFDECLTLGQNAELRVAEEFLKNGWIVQLNSDKERYDFWVYGGLIYLIEVKNEDKFSDSGNIIIEMYQGLNGKKPSGIKVSESNIFIHTLKNMAVLYRTQSMRSFISERWPKLKYELKDFKNADNGNGGLTLAIANFFNYSWFDYCDFENITRSKVFEVPKSSDSNKPNLGNL